MNYFLRFLFLFFVFGCSHKPAENPPEQADLKIQEVQELKVQPMTLEAVYQRVQPALLGETKNEVIKESDREFGALVRREYSSKSAKEELQNLSLHVFANKENRVNQVALIIQNCRTQMMSEEQLQKEFIQFVGSMSQMIFGQKFELLGKNYFPKIQTTTPKEMRVLIQESYDAASMMRLSRQRYKCDGAGGYGYRFDFFVK